MDGAVPRMGQNIVYWNGEMNYSTISLQHAARVVGFWVVYNSLYCVHVYQFPSFRASQPHDASQSQLVQTLYFH